VAIASVSCSKTATAPTPPPPPPAAAPTISCPDAISATADASGSARINYPHPENHGGEGAVTITCAPESGEAFPVGATQVECTIKDALNRSASCSFSVTITAAPRLRLTRFMAFGDSLTAGEIVVPGGDDTETRPNPDAAYPAVLAGLLSARYTTQNLIVTNRGKAAEQAERALGRFVDSFLQDSPEAVIILEGVNDIVVAPTSGLGVDTAERGVSALAADARNRHARVFLVDLPPTKAGRRRVPLSTIQAFNERLRGVARGEGAVFVDVFSALLPDVDAMVGSDGLHLTVAGYQRVAEIVYAAVRNDLEIK
jgi:lysophospholipase L1-like esterase